MCAFTWSTFEPGAAPYILSRVNPSSQPIRRAKRLLSDLRASCCKLKHREPMFLLGRNEAAGRNAAAGTTAAQRMKALCIFVVRYKQSGSSLLGGRAKKNENDRFPYPFFTCVAWRRWRHNSILHGLIGRQMPEHETLPIS